MIVKEMSYEISDPTVETQIVTLQGVGVDTLFLAATPKAAAQAIRKIGDMGWVPVRYLVYVSASIISTLKPAGLDKSKGLISATVVKDPNDARWQGDAALKDYDAFIAKYLSLAVRNELFAVNGYYFAATMVHVLKQCGDDLSRENIMRQAANIKDFEAPMLLPGVKVNTSPENFYPLRQLQLERFNGEQWELFSDLMSD